MGQCSMGSPEAFLDVQAPRYDKLAGNWTGADGCELIKTASCSSSGQGLCGPRNFAVDGSGDVTIRKHAGQQSHPQPASFCDAPAHVFARCWSNPPQES